MLTVRRSISEADQSTLAAAVYQAPFRFDGRPSCGSFAAPVYDTYNFQGAFRRAQWAPPGAPTFVRTEWSSGFRARQKMVGVPVTQAKRRVVDTAITRELTSIASNRV